MRRIKFIGVRFVLFGIVAVGILGFLTAGLWNVLMPVIAGLPKISFWQALGLLVLSRVLFGRFGGWGNKMRQARCVRGWHDLTPEERERFRQAMGDGAPGGLSDGGEAGKA